MPKMPGSFEGAVAASIEEWLHRYIPAMADSLGPLPDTVIPSQREKLERWNLRTDKVPPEMTPQLADEAVQMILSEYEQAGKPRPDDDTLTKLVAAKVNKVLLPYRELVYGNGLPRPAERVKEAARYSRLDMKAQTGVVQEVGTGLQAPAVSLSPDSAASMPPAPMMAPPTAPAQPEMPAALASIGQQAGVI